MAKAKSPRSQASKESPMPTEEPQASPMRVHELMTSSPRACSMHDSANAAAQIMWEQDCGAVPVLGDDGRVVGILTDRDVCMAAYFQGRPLSGISVASIMSTNVCTCRADDDLNHAERLMQERQVNRLPVVEDGGILVGMLSLCDVTQGFKRAGGLRQPNRAGQELLETVAAIREPRSPKTLAS
jgi:CBS domain-containing protein